MAEQGEQLQRTEKPLPPTFSKPFGRGLEQLIAKQVKEIKNALSPVKDRNKEDLIKSLAMIEGVIEDLKTKEVKIVPFSSGWRLSFSKDIEEEKPVPGTVAMEGTLVKEFVSALLHEINNPLGSLMAFTGQVKSIDTKTKINSASQKINQDLTKFWNVDKIIILTAADGKTTLMPIKSLSAVEKSK